MFDVPIPAGAPPVIRLTGFLPAGVAGAVALVGRTGADPAAGEVTSNLTPMPGGGTAAVSLDDPARFGRITAVVVNADASHAGFDQGAGDYVFTRDAGDVVVALAEPGLAVPVTGPAQEVADHAAVVTGSVDPHLLDTTWFVEYGRTTGYGSRTPDHTLPASTVGSAPVVSQLDNLRARTTYHYRLVATNPTGSAAGADMTFTTARDVTKPKVSVVVKRQRAERVRRRGLRWRARCSERCTGTAELTLSRRLSRRLGLPAVLARTRVALPARPRSTALRLRLGRRAARRLPLVSRGFAAILRVKVADEARNRVVVTRRVTIAR